MRKDFVRKPKSNRKNQTQKRKNTLSTREYSASLKWYSAGLASGVILSLMIYLYSLPNDTGNIIPEASGQSSVTNKIMTKQKITQFEFYDILPEKESTPNKPALNIETSKSIDENRVFFLQAGAFKKEKDAEMRRAELLLLDLEPQIKLTQETNGSLYRLTVGPLDSLRETKKVQRLIENEGIKTLLKQRLKQ